VGNTSKDIGQSEHRADESPDRVVIAIPTYRRAQSLRRLLAAIETLDTAADIRVVVTDNEGEAGSGFAVVSELADHYRFPLVAIAAPQKGLANVRNVMVRYARHTQDLDYLVMIDDDERPSPAWISALIDMQKRTGCNIVGGPTEPVFEPGTAEWPNYCPLFWSGRFDDGVIDMNWGTCNVLFHRRALELTPEDLFDPIFNELGGEDVDAFMRLKSLGCRFAWTNAAIVFDDIPSTRTTLGWITKRAFRIGNSNMLAQLRWKYGRFAYAKALIATLAGLLIHTALLLLSMGSARKRVENYCVWVRTTGKLAFLLGRSHNEYR
jgi:succinoglycan biosynthesis protein ExoM